MSTSISYICTPIRQAQRKQHSTAKDNNSSCVHSCLCSTVAAAGPDAAALTLSCRYASACRHGCMKRPTASSSLYIMDDWCFSASKRSPPGANSCKQQQQKPQPELSWSPACCCWYTRTPVAAAVACLSNTTPSVLAMSWQLTCVFPRAVQTMPVLSWHWFQLPTNGTA